MRSPMLVILSTCSTILAIALPLRAATAADADLPKLFAEAAKYESGQSAEPLQKIEQLLRDSAAKPALRAELEAAAVKLLVPSATFEARRFACQLLAVVGTDDSLPAVAKLLASDETAGIGCLALSTRRSPKAIAVLRDALASAHGRTRLQIISALGNHRDAQSVTTFAELARNSDAAVAQMAILALGKIGTAPAHQAIAALGKEAGPAQAAAVTEATLRVARQLAAAGDRKAAASIYMGLLQPKAPTNIRRGAWAALVKLDEDGGEQRIIKTLGGHDGALIPVAIARVASLKSDGASKTFAAMLPRLSPSAQAWMIEALAIRGDAGAREAIRAQLTAGEALVRRAAIAAVGKVEDDSAVPLLVNAMARTKARDELQDLELALCSLRGGHLTDHAIVGELVPRITPRPTDVKVRLMSVLGRRGAHEAVPILLAEIAYTGWEHPEIANVRAAWQALGKVATADDLSRLLEHFVGTAADPKLVEARADAQLAAARVMAKVADVSRRSEEVRGILARCDLVQARCALLQLLPNAADAKALAALKAAVEDKEPRVRDAAVRALAGWPDAAAWKALVGIYLRPQDNAHRALALRALVRLAGELNAKPDATLVDRYRHLLSGARGDDDRKLILSALAGAAHPEALKLALSLLSNAGVRAETELAVKKIAASIAAQHPQAAQAALERLKQAKP